MIFGILATLALAFGLVLLYELGLELGAKEICEKPLLHPFHKCSKCIKDKKVKKHEQR